MHRHFALPIAACALLAGCSNDPAPLAIEDYAGATADLSCGAWFECCTEAEIAALFADVSTPITTRDECASYYSLLYGMTFSSMIDAVEEGRLGYDAELAGRCFSDFESRTCDQLRMISVGMTTDGCDRIFTPRVEDGGACSSSQECIGGRCTGAAGEMGVCERLPVVGESCTGTCESGAWCDAGTCTAELADGAACTSPIECRSFRCESGTCTPLDVSICGTSTTM